MKIMSSQNEKPDLPERERNYQAHVHFALGGIIQGLMLAALAGEFSNALRAFTYPATLWTLVTALQSLLLCILFWYRFMDNFIFGFRVINLNAKTHFLFAAHHLILGLLQFLAIRFMYDTRLWLTFYALLILTTLGFSYLSSHLKIIELEGAKDALAYEPDTNFLLIAVSLTMITLVGWYLFPGLESDLFRAVALLFSGASIIAFILYSIKVFDQHLNWCKQQPE
jgi:hypothetical protein